MRAATVSVVHSDAMVAGREVADGLTQELGRAPSTVLLFVTSRHDPARVLAGLSSRMPADRVVVGCSSIAEINAEEGLAASVTAMGIDGISCASFKVDSLLPDSRKAGRALAEQAKAFGPTLLVTFPDGIRGNPAEYVRGLQDVLGATFPIVGGVASEHLAFERTHEIHGREVMSGGAVALAIRGTSAVAMSAKSGFQPVGAFRTITKTLGKNLILELDGEPALRIYKDSLGRAIHDSPSVGIEFPLLVNLDPGGDWLDSDERMNVVRVVRKLDEERGGLLLSSEIEVGMKVQMTCSTKDDLLRAAADACEAASRQLPSPDLALFFGCAGRKTILGGRYREEIRRAFASLDARIPRVGFYAYGELAPVRGVSICHDETFSVVLLKA